MDNSEMMSRIEVALSREVPVRALATLAADLLEEGASLRQLIVLLTADFERSEEVSLQLRADTLGDVLDMLTGYFVPSPSFKEAVRLVGLVRDCEATS